MSKTRINKIDAARRQLDAGIRMTFGEEDPVAVHSVVAAAHRIIRDICENRGNIESYLRFKDWIRPDHEKEFWRHWHASANFLKHAKNDPTLIHDLDDESSDFLILLSSKWYRDLGYALTVEMRVFAGWWAFQHPDTIKTDYISTAGISDEFATIAQGMTLFSRNTRLRLGDLALQRAKAENHSK